MASGNLLTGGIFVIVLIYTYFSAQTLQLMSLSLSATPTTQAAELEGAVAATGGQAASATEARCARTK